ncbi:hypothetical protein C1Y63_02525 [Corynebacterium sp. 13CS0277]|uniref:hypothetical protein n=1 Tax=Corynebacterium sp. 13CS0277 TaxID=2071994 RepID=UPI000D027270|nr:hypothetical protein [Corynebacterium sp. 13CS0277]PRQ12205.1 hypothetical protein C1Y63_02525 [Corynebacterium sp. 13CS0277]
MTAPFSVIHRGIALLGVALALTLSYWAAVLVAGEKLPGMECAFLVTTSPTVGSDAEFLHRLDTTAREHELTIAAHTAGRDYVTGDDRGGRWLAHGSRPLPGSPARTFAPVTDLADARQFYTASACGEELRPVLQLAEDAGVTVVQQPPVEASFLLSGTVLGGLIATILLALSVATALSVFCDAHAVAVGRLAGMPLPRHVLFHARRLHGSWAWLYLAVPVAALGGTAVVFGWDAASQWLRYAVLACLGLACALGVAFTAAIAACEWMNLRRHLARLLPIAPMVMILALAQLAVAWPLLTQARDATNAAREFQAQSTEAHLWEGREEAITLRLVGARNFDKLSGDFQALGSALHDAAARNDLLIIETQYQRDGTVIVLSDAARAQAAPDLPAVHTPTVVVPADTPRGAETVTPAEICADDCPRITAPSTTVFTFSQGIGAFAERLTATPDALVLLPPGYADVSDRYLVSGVSAGWILLADTAAVDALRARINDPGMIASARPAAERWHDTHAHARTHLVLTVGALVLGSVLLLGCAVIAGALYRATWRQHLHVHHVLGVFPTRIVATIIATQVAIAAAAIARALAHRRDIDSHLATGSWTANDSLVHILSISNSALALVILLSMAAATITATTSLIPRKDPRP